MSAVEPKVEQATTVRLEHPVMTGWALAWGFLLQTVVVALIVAVIVVVLVQP